MAASGSLILEEGETSAAINITILEVNLKKKKSFYTDLCDIRRVIFWNLKLPTYILREVIYFIVIQKDRFDFNVKITEGQIITESSSTCAQVKLSCLIKTLPSDIQKSVIRCLLWDLTFSVIGVSAFKIGQKLI